MNRIDHKPGRGSGRSRLAMKTPVNVTAAATSQINTPAPRTHGVDPDDSTMMPAIPTASPRYPTRRAQTAILQCLLCSSSAGSSIARSMPDGPVRRRVRLIHRGITVGIRRAFPCHSANRNMLYGRADVRSRPPAPYRLRPQAYRETSSVHTASSACERRRARPEGKNLSDLHGAASGCPKHRLRIEFSTRPIGSGTLQV